MGLLRQEMQARKTSGRRLGPFRKPLWTLPVLLVFQLVKADSFLPAPRSPIANTNLEMPAKAWPPGRRFTDLDRDRAVARGLNYIYRTSLNLRNFAQYSGDYLWCFYTLAVAAHDEHLKQMARRMGVEITSTSRARLEN
jgi:hypothetical protein